MDVRESDKELVLEAELPGINEKDISLDLGLMCLQLSRRSCDLNFRAAMVARFP
jgi:HSP20 family molecular chaperone IbpA